MLNSLLDVMTVGIRWKKFVLNFQAFSHLCFKLFGMFLNDLIDGSTSNPRPV